MGRLRGKRNRDQDRYWTIQRRASQEGMVGALDVPVCCFCGALTPSDEAIWAHGDVVCQLCGFKRGMTEFRLTRGRTEALDTLAILGAVVFDEPDSRSHRRVGHIVNFQVGTEVKLDRWVRERQDKEQKARLRVHQRALLWLMRDRTVAHDEVLSEADALAEMPIVDARAAVTALRWSVYRQRYPRRQSEMPRKFTHAQIEIIRQVYATGTRSLERLAREYGTTGSTIHLVVTGSIYKGAGGPIHIPKSDFLLPEICLRDRLERNRRINELAGSGLVGLSASRGLRTDLGPQAADDRGLVGALDDGQGWARVSMDCAAIGPVNVARGLIRAHGSGVGEGETRDGIVANTPESDDPATGRTTTATTTAVQGVERRGPSRDPAHRRLIRRLAKAGIDFAVCHDKQGKAYIKAVGTASPEPSRKAPRRAAS